MLIAPKSASTQGIRWLKLFPFWKTPTVLRNALSLAIGTAAILLCTGVSNAMVGDWRSYTPLHHVTCLASYQGKLFAGTTGGIRQFDPKVMSEKVYDNLQGLFDVWITSLVIAHEGTDSATLWAISKSGFVQRFDGNRFEAFGQGYVAENWSMIPRGAASGGSYLALASAKGLTFFDTRTQSAVASLTRFGSEVGDTVLAVLRRDDSLYISTPSHAYVAALDWNNLLSVQKYGSIFDPRIWKPIVFPEDDTTLTEAQRQELLPDYGDTTQAAFTRAYNQLLFENNRLQSYPEGTILPGKVRIEALVERELKVKGKSFAGVTQFETAIKIGDQYFAGGTFGLLQARSRSDTLVATIEGYPPSRKYPTDPVLNITFTNGKAYAQTKTSFVDFSGADANLYGIFLPPMDEIELRTLRNLTSDSLGTIYVGTWGVGLVRVRNGNPEYFTGVHPCPFQINPKFSYTVFQSISRPMSGGLWVGIFEKESTLEHQIAYFDDADEKFTCFDNLGNGGNSHFIEPLNDHLLAMGGDDGLFLFQYSTRPATLTRFKVIKASGNVNDSWGAHLDAYNRLWFLQGGKLGWVDSLEEKSVPQVEPNIVDRFTGSECHTLKQDPARGMWAGCANGLYQIIPADPPSETRIVRYTLHDGLLSNKVVDLAVDPASGNVWVATDRGVSQFTAGVATPRKSLSEVTVYPNPFRKQHRAVVFDQLPPNAEVRIHTQAGQVVRTFHPRDLHGYQAQWDGTNDAGKPVVAGIYLYTVKSGSSVRRGRLIVAR